MASKKLSEMTDDERYGKVGAEIRRLDPEAYKNRPKTLEGNLKLLKELRAKSKGEGSSRSKPTVDFAAEMRRPRPTTNFATEGRVEPSVGEPSKAMRDEARADVIGKEGVIAERATAAMKRNRGNLPSDRATGFRSQAEETGMTADERAAKARDYAKNIAMTAGVGRVGAAAGAPYARTIEGFRRAGDKASESAGRSLVRKNIPSFSERYRAREAAEKARENSPRRLRERAERMLDEKLAADMAGGFNKGGRVKKYAGGGSVSSRADGIAKRGKTRCRII